MTNPQPDARLNVPNRLVSPPVGDFSLASAGEVSVPVPGAGAIVGKAEAPESGVGSIGSTFQMGNLSMPAGEIVTATGARVTAADELTFTSQGHSQVVEGLSVAPPPLSAPGSTKDASLDLGTTKFTY